MGQPFVGEIRMVGFNFAPQGWAFCGGQQMPISQNDTLFNLIGTTYGGDGQETFNLPDLQGRLPLHAGQGQGLSNKTLGEVAGSENVTLTTQQIPPHNHLAAAKVEAGDQASPNNAVWAASGQSQYGTGAGNLAMKTTLVGGSGGSQPHDNMMPYTVVNFIISLFGVYPSQT